MAPRAEVDPALAERERAAVERERTARVKLAGMNEQEVARMELYATAIGEAVESAVDRCIEKHRAKDPERKQGKSIFDF